VSLVDQAPRRTHKLPWLVTFLGGRAVWAVITLSLYLTVVFVLIQVWVPFNWASQFKLGGPGDYEAALESVGLDRPILERYLDFAGGLVTGDLGTSYDGGPVWDVIAATAPVTIFVFAVGAVLAYVVGEALGRFGAWHRSLVGGTSLSTVGVLSTTIFPPFLVFLIARYLRDPLFDLRDAMGLPTDSLEIWRDSAVEPNEVLLLMSLALFGAVIAGVAVRLWAHRNRLRWVGMAGLPVTILAAMAGIALSGVGTEAIDLLYRIDISTSVRTGSPLLVLIGIVLITFGQVMFMMRVGIEDEREEDYVLTARAKGLAEHEVRDRHVARNALAPAIAGSFLAIPTLLAGMIIIEFGLDVHGLSSTFFQAVESQDIPVLMGVLVILGVFGVGLRIVADLSIAYLDPRQRKAEI